jgi:lipid-A-disaccharide synthase-like uncharacterized protein
MLQLSRVITRKDASEFAAVMPLTYSVLLNGILWFAYGVSKQDPFLTVPNAIAIAVSIAQIVCVFKYTKQKTYALVDESVV